MERRHSCYRKKASCRSSQPGKTRSPLHHDAASAATWRRKQKKEQHLVNQLTACLQQVGWVTLKASLARTCKHQKDPLAHSRNANVARKRAKGLRDWVNNSCEARGPCDSKACSFGRWSMARLANSYQSARVCEALATVAYHSTSGSKSLVKKPHGSCSSWAS